MSGLIISFRLVGTILLGIKLIGIKKNKIIKKCVGKTIELDNELNAFVLKEVYIDMFKENAYATLGIIYMIISEILNLFCIETMGIGDKNTIILNTFICGVILYIIATCMVYILTNIISKNEKDKIQVDKGLIDNGVVAVQYFEEKE